MANQEFLIVFVYLAAIFNVNTDVVSLHHVSTLDGLEFNTNVHLYLSS